MSSTAPACTSACCEVNVGPSSTMNDMLLGTVTFTHVEATPV